NKDRNFPPALLRGVHQVRQAADPEKEAVFHQGEAIALTHPHLGAELAIACTGHLGYFTYYACGHEGGAVYLAIKTCPPADKKPRQPMAAMKTILAGISALEVVNHKEAVRAYLGEPILTEGAQLTWPAGGAGLKVTFDDQGRIAEMSGVPLPSNK